MRIFYCFIFFIIGLMLSFLTNYFYIKSGKFADYTQIIITGFYSFIPFIPVSNIKFRFSRCFLMFFITANLIFSPVYLTGVNDIIISSILIYTLFLSIIFCKNKTKGAR